mmetsp:Transcript_52362/g.147457  ORF Transcript_52362/g.147457 Transcript_52362/m.147457 type:complete len:227 (+) Transcript_52362:966-1646(+)
MPGGCRSSEGAGAESGNCAGAGARGPAGWKAGALKAGLPSGPPGGGPPWPASNGALGCPAPAASSTSRAGGGVGFTARPVVCAKPRKRFCTMLPTLGRLAGAPCAPPGGLSTSLNSRMLARKASENRLCGTAFTKACMSIMYLRALSLSPTSASSIACANLNGWIVGHRAFGSEQRMAYSNVSESCSPSGSKRRQKCFGLLWSTPMRHTRAVGSSTAIGRRSPVSK